MYFATGLFAISAVCRHLLEYSYPQSAPTSGFVVPFALRLIGTTANMTANVELVWNAPAIFKAIAYTSARYGIRAWNYLLPWKIRPVSSCVKAVERGQGTCHHNSMSNELLIFCCTAEINIDQIAKAVLLEHGSPSFDLARAVMDAENAETGEGVSLSQINIGVGFLAGLWFGALAGLVEYFYGSIRFL